MFEPLRAKIAHWIAPPIKARVGARMYGMAKASRLTDGWGTSTTSEDAELSSSLRSARNRSRQLMRDAAYAKRAKVIVQNNIIGSGIGMQAKVLSSRGKLNDRVNDDIEAAWDRWACASSCHTGGAMHFCDLERALVGETFEAGEIFPHLHLSRFGESTIPVSIEMIEPERIADQFQPSPVAAQARVRLGIETDRYHRALAYWIRTVHPGDISLIAEQVDRLERIPAEQILHLRVIDRWPQTRGMPWIHAAARKLNDMDGLTEAEITAARAAACYMGFIETPDGESSFGGDGDAAGAREEELSPALIRELNPGEKFSGFKPDRPNSQIDAFMRLMLREVAAGTGSSYESLSRDYSQSNYSSSRLALIDDRDLWRTLQSWFIRSFRYPLHRIWLRQAVLARAIPSINLEEYANHPTKFEAVMFKPRGWSWIDPTKEVQAYKDAIRSGFMTISQVIAMTGSGYDFEDLIKERQQELDMAKSAGLVFDTDPAQVSAAGQGATQDELQEDEDPAVTEAEKMLRAAGKETHHA